MRRNLVFLLTILMMLGLAACGDDDSSQKSGDWIQEDAGSVDAASDSGPDAAEEPGCSSDDECEDGLLCRPTAGETYDTCQPEPEPDPVGLDDGEACGGDGDCAGGTCIPGPEWPDGYCTTMGCQSREDCAAENSDNRCLTGRGYNICVRMCDSMNDCRDGYSCQPIGNGQAICVPGGGGSGGSAEPGLEDAAEYPFGITCGLQHDAGELAVDYEVAQDTVSYMITPFARDGARLSPERILLPDDSDINFDGPNHFQAIPSQLFGFVNPIVTPVIDTFSDQLQAGSHTLELQTGSEDLCYYLLEESTPGNTIDFNIYLVGVPGVDASNAANSADMQETLQWFETIYAQAGIELDNVNFYDISGEDAEAYSVVRSEGDLQQLVALSQRPAGGYDEVLSANIFFVRSMQLGGGGAIGISLGLPGAAGLHGTPSSGVVFTSEYMGEEYQDRDGSVVDGNKLTGIVLAHELGHFLGLFHTSEQYGQGFDPLDDTPECTSGFPNNCPDIDNLMFPLAGVSHTELSPGQIHTIKANPLTKD